MGDDVRVSVVSGQLSVEKDTGDEHVVIVTPPWPPGEAALEMEPCLLAYGQQSGLVG
jgi:hypothetical protein